MVKPVKVNRTNKVIAIKHTCVFEGCDSEVYQRIWPGDKVIEIKRFKCVKHADTPYGEMKTEEILEDGR